MSVKYSMWWQNEKIINISATNQSEMKTLCDWAACWFRHCFHGILGFVFHGTSVTHMVKNLPATQEIQVQFLGWEDPLGKGMATHSSTLDWRIHGPRRLVSYSPWGHKESDTTERLTLSLPFMEHQLQRTISRQITLIQADISSKLDTVSLENNWQYLLPKITLPMILDFSRKKWEFGKHIFYLELDSIPIYKRLFW